MCIIGEAAFAARPQASGAARAAPDACALAEALSNNNDALAALAQWEPGQLDVEQQLLNSTHQIGRRSQADGAWVAGDPALISGLHGPGV